MAWKVEVIGIGNGESMVWFVADGTSFRLHGIWDEQSYAEGIAKRFSQTLASIESEAVKAALPESKCAEHPAPVWYDDDKCPLCDCVARHSENLERVVLEAQGATRREREARSAALTWQGDKSCPFDPED